MYDFAPHPHWTNSLKNWWMIQQRMPSFVQTWLFIRHATLTVHYGYSLAIESTSVEHSILWCIVGEERRGEERKGEGLSITPGYCCGTLKHTDCFNKK